MGGGGSPQPCSSPELTVRGCGRAQEFVSAARQAGVLESEVAQFFQRAAGSADNPGGDTFGAACPQCAGGVLQLRAEPGELAIACSASPACRNQRSFPRAAQSIAISATAVCPNPNCNGAKLLEFSFRRMGVRPPTHPPKADTVITIMMMMMRMMVIIPLLTGNTPVFFIFAAESYICSHR